MEQPITSIDPEENQKRLAAQLFAKHGDRFSEYQWMTPYDRAVLHKFRLRGGQKFQKVSPGDWLGPLKLTNKHKLACMLHAAGVLNRYVCRRLRYSESRLSIILSSSNARFYVALLKERFGSDVLFRRVQKWGIEAHEIWGAW